MYPCGRLGFTYILNPEPVLVANVRQSRAQEPDRTKKKGGAASPCRVCLLPRVGRACEAYAAKSNSTLAMMNEWVVSPLLVICFALLIRHMVSLWPYSGQGDAPMYGDYEAQRHWMEITTGLPIDCWYR